MGREAGIEALGDEANWPPHPDPRVHDIWRRLFTAEQLYDSFTRRHVDCHDPRADGRYEHPSSIPRHYRRGRR